MDPSSNEQDVEPGMANSSRRRENRHVRFNDSEFIPVSTSTSDPGPSSRNRRHANLGRNGRNGVGRNQSRRGHGRRGSGNVPRSLFTTTTRDGTLGSRNFDPPEFPQDVSGDREYLEETFPPQPMIQYDHFFQPSSAKVISYLDQHLGWNAFGETVDDNTLGCVINPRGFLTLRLNPYVRIDISAGQALRIQDNHLQIIMALSGTGSMASLVHPSGCVYQYGSRVEVCVPDEPHNEMKIAKMWHKGISFSSENCALVYLLDSAGVRTTTDVFSDLSGDISCPVFRTEEAMLGPEQIQRCMSFLRAGSFWISGDKTENWAFNGIKISCNANGVVRVVRGHGKYIFRTSVKSSGASITTPHLYVTASVGAGNNFFVKRGERRVHYNGQTFAVRNGGQSAGIDSRNKLKVY